VSPCYLTTPQEIEYLLLCLSCILPARPVGRNLGIRAIGDGLEPLAQEVAKEIGGSQGRAHAWIGGKLQAGLSDGGAVPRPLPDRRLDPANGEVRE
jgi:hypothetical protein